MTLFIVIAALFIVVAAIGVQYSHQRRSGTYDLGGTSRAAVGPSRVRRNIVGSGTGGG